MFVAWCGLEAAAGRLFAIDDPEAAAPTWVEVGPAGKTATLTTWPDRPVELVFVADLTGSVIREGESPWQMADALVAAYDALSEDPRPGDKIGVTAYADAAVRWVPLGSLDRPGLRDQLASFGGPYRDPADRGRGLDEYADVFTDDPTAPSAGELGYRRNADSPQKGVREAVRDLVTTEDDPLRVVVLLWDGGTYRSRNLARVLSRAEANEVHVWSLGIGVGLDPEGAQLATRGAGDAYIGGEYAAMAMRRIVAELRVDEVGDDDP